jgi:L-2-hydroxycarboxylate dehydrogenase (NAD+)
MLAGTDAPIVAAGYLRRIYEAIADRFGATPEEARLFAGGMVLADLQGKETQGIALIRLFYDLLKDGAGRFGTPIRVVREGRAFAVVDGAHGMGQIVATHAMDIAIKKAGEAGVGAAWACHTNDIGMAAYYSMRALEHGYVGIVMTNGCPLVAPWGGRDQLFSTNPFSAAIPAGSERPILIDTSASAMSHGKVIMAARDRRRLPLPLLVDEEGRFTDDPVPFIVDAFDRESAQRGAILPLGHKGFTWVLLVDVLAGIMSGMTASKDVPEPPTKERPSTLGQFFLAIDVAAIMPLPEFKAKIDDLIRSVKASRLADGFSEILLPGERAQREAERRMRDGIPIRREEWDKVVAIAGELGLDLEALRPEGTS